MEITYTVIQKGRACKMSKIPRIKRNLFCWQLATVVQTDWSYKKHWETFEGCRTRDGGEEVGVSKDSIYVILKWIKQK